MTIFVFTPPTENVVSNVAWEVPPLWNRLMRHYPTRKRGRAIWELMDYSLTFDQPYPSIEATGANQASLSQDPNVTNLLALTYRRVFLGGHIYFLDSTNDADFALLTTLQDFLPLEGYDFNDWVVPEGAGLGGYAGGYAGGYGG